MRVNKEARVIFHGEPGFGGSQSTLEVSYDNMGEPYRQGASFYFRDGGNTTSVFLHGQELFKLHEMLCELLVVDEKRAAARRGQPATLG